MICASNILVICENNNGFSPQLKNIVDNGKRDARQYR